MSSGNDGGGGAEEPCAYRDIDAPAAACSKLRTKRSVKGSGLCLGRGVRERKMGRG